MITVLEEKCTSFNFIPQMLKEIGHIMRKKFTTRSLDQHKNKAIMKMFKSDYCKNILKTSGLLWALKSCYVI